MSKDLTSFSRGIKRRYCRITNVAINASQRSEEVVGDNNNFFEAYEQNEMVVGDEGEYGYQIGNDDVTYEELIREGSDSDSSGEDSSSLSHQSSSKSDDWSTGPPLDNGNVANDQFTGSTETIVVEEVVIPPQSAVVENVRNTSMTTMSAVIQQFNEIDSRDQSLSCKALDAQIPFEPNTYRHPLLNTAKQHKTKEQFCIEFSKMASFQGLTQANNTAIFNVLASFLPGVPWPKCAASGKCCIDNYVAKDMRLIPIHVCNKGCTAFISKHSKSIKCDTCSSYRFVGCKRRPCKDNLECDPFFNGHTIKKRISNRDAFYRPIIPLLKELVNWSIISKNEVYLGAKSHTREHIVDDISGSAQFAFHKEQMNFNFERFVDSKRRDGSNCDFLQVSLCLSDFYDGGILFKRQSKSINPMVITILDCRPDIRTKAGLGMFLVALHDLAAGCGAEQMIFNELYIPELNCLANGIPFTVTDAHGKITNVFLQARLVFHQLDTIALLKVYRFQGVNSKVGCLLCESCPGVSRQQTIDRVINFGYRKFLPGGHFLRRCGVSGNCCPCGYYDGSLESIEAVNLLFQNFKIKNNNMNKLPTPPPAVLTDVKVGCDGSMFTEPLDDSMFNSKYNMRDFSRYLYYAHCCFTEQKRYSRRPNSFYKAMSKKYRTIYAELAKLLEKDNKLSGDEKRKKLKNQLKKFVNDFGGIGGTNIYDQLNYDGAGIYDTVCYDPFHCLMNLVLKIIHLLKGIKGSDAKGVKLSQCEGRFPDMKFKSKDIINGDELLIDHDNGVKKKKKNGRKIIDPKPRKKSMYSDIIDNTRQIPWLLTNGWQKSVDWFHNCILIPIGLKDSHSFRFLFKHTNNLIGNDKIKLLTIFLNFDLSHTPLPQEYKNLIRLFSELVADILTPTVNDSELADLFMRVIEALCLWEGMFPDSEQYFCVHEMIDIIEGMSRFGPVRGWWTLAGERFMSKLKKHCPKGGKKCVKILVEKFTAYENNFKHNHIIDSKSLDNEGKFSDNMIKLTGTLHTIPRLFWNGWVYGCFLDYLYEYLLTLEIAEKELCYRSPYFRLYTTYKYWKKKKTFGGVATTFLYWLFHLHDTEFGDVEFIDEPTQQYIDVRTGELSLLWIDKTVLGVDYRTNEKAKLVLILKCDVPTILDILTFVPTITNRAIIKGITQRGRGADCSETQLSDRLGHYAQNIFLPTNVSNNIKSTFHLSEQYSSWMKCYCYKKLANSVKCDDDIIRYVQANYFFRLTCFKSDPLLYGRSFGNITSRTHSYNNSQCPFVLVNTTTRQQNREVESNVRKAGLGTYKPVTNFEHDNMFVCLDFVASTNVATCPVTLDNKPILVIHTDYDNDEHNEANQYCSKNNKDIDKLYMIDLHPERKSVSISNRDATLIELCKK